MPDTHVAPAHQHARARADGRPVSAGRVLQYNDDVEIGICVPEAEADYFYRDGEGDEVIFVHEGEGDVETIFGTLPVPQARLRRDPARDDVPLPLRRRRSAG